MDGMTGVYFLVAALLLAGLAALALQWKNGRFSASAVDSAVAADDGERISESELGAPLGERATLVQFSSSFCAPCRATRVILQDVVAVVDGVSTVEVDVETSLELAEQHKVMRTPTVLVLDASGRVAKRASGLPTRDQVLAAVADVVDA